MKRNQGTLSVTEAVKLINEQYGESITRMSLEAWIRSGRCPFGEYLRRDGKLSGAYHLFRGRMEAYFRPQHDIGRAVIDNVYISEPTNPRDCWACFPNVES